MKVSEFNYELPKELIAQHPYDKRDEARLMVLDREKQTIEHKVFKDIIDYLKENGYKVGLFSNLRLMDYNRYRTKIKDIHFDYLFLSYEMGCIKPEDTIFKKVIYTCACAPHDIIFFDDNDRHVIAARNNGISSYKATGDTIKKIFESFL